MNSKAEESRLSLRLREAAKALGVSERTLWTWTQQGTIPHVRRGKTILYPTAALTHWLQEQTKATAMPATANLADGSAE